MSGVSQRIAVIGGEGQLGRELVKVLPDALPLTHTGRTGYQIDIADPGSVRRVMDVIDPEIIINAAAMTNVDLCEENKDLAFRVNGEAVRFLVREARKRGATFIQISTDYIFDGEQGNYSEKATPNPINYYGISKLIGESYALSYEKTIVVRTSGVFGHARNFPLFVLSELRKGNSISVHKSYYSPIHARNLALSIRELLHSDILGIINIAGERISRYDLAVAIAKTFSLDESLLRLVSEPDFFKARRPYDSSLSVEKAKRLVGFDFYSMKSNLGLLGKLK